MPSIPEFLGERGSREEMDHVRSGTARKFESEWVKVQPGQVSEFIHNFGEVPSNVTVDYALSDDGSNPQDAASPREILHQFTFDPISRDTNEAETKSVTVVGAELGDFVQVAAPYDLQDIIVTGYVQAADTVEIRVANLVTGATTNLASGTWSILVRKPTAVEVRKVDSQETKGSETTTLTVINNALEARYFKVRAL